MCDDISIYKEEQVLVQKYVSHLTIYATVLKTIPISIIALISGPYEKIIIRQRKTNFKVIYLDGLTDMGGSF